MDLFSKQDSREYFSSKIAMLKNEIASMSDEQILSCNFDEWIDYLQQKYSVIVLTFLGHSLQNSKSARTPWQKTQYNIFA